MTQNKHVRDLWPSQRLSKQPGSAAGGVCRHLQNVTDRCGLTTAQINLICWPMHADKLNSSY